jgi:D-xylonolactonase
MASLEFRIVRHGGEKAQLGESPFWDPAGNDLWWVDITGRKLLRLDTATHEFETWDMPECPGFVVLMAPRRPAVGMQTGIFAFTPQGGTFERLVAFEQAGCRFNDAAIDRNGGLWVSTMALDAGEGRGAVHRVTPDLRLRQVAGGVTIPNGLAVDLERGRLYYSDSDPLVQTIWHVPLEAGVEPAGDARFFATTRALAGRPDGAALDRQGSYWIAGVDGSGIYVFDPDGGLQSTLPVPFSAPTKVSFSGPSGRAVAVTSKQDRGDGGYIALADIPSGMTPGMPQPYWIPAKRPEMEKT